MCVCCTAGNNKVFCVFVEWFSNEKHLMRSFQFIQYIRKASTVTNQAIPIYVVLIFLRWLTDLKHEIKLYFL